MIRHDWKTETQEYVKNLLSIYLLASPEDIKAGKAWYGNARKYAKSLARKYNVSLDIAAGVIAALSPGQEWEKNKRSADEFMREYRNCDRCTLARLDLATYGNGPIQKAYAIANGAPIGPTLHGPKTTAFYRAIVDPMSPDVVIDGHAKSAALGVRYGNHNNGVKVERNEYSHLEHAYRIAAATVGLTPNQFQAIIWIVWKKQPTGYRLYSEAIAA